MKKLYSVLFIMIIILVTQHLYAQNLPNPKIISSFTPDSSCIQKDPHQGTGSDGKHTCLYACENHYATYCASVSATHTFAWTVAGGTIGGNTTATGIGLTCVTVLWGPSGTGNLTVIETDSAGNTGLDNTCVTIINSPKAIFNPSSTTACLGTAVNFNDASLNAITWIWNFGDPASGGNNTTAIQNPSHVFSGPGTYTVTLVVFNQCGCSDTAQKTITITNVSGPRIDCPATVCAGTEKCYSTPDGCPGAVYTWTVVGGTRLAPFGSTNNICVQWGSGNPQGSITLTITGCGSVCPGPTTVNIPIVPSSTTITGSTVACINSNPIYSLPAWPGTCYNWSVPAGAATIIAGDSTNHIQVHWNSIGTYTITVSWHNDLLGCPPGSATIQVTVKPEFSIIGPTDPVCLNSTSSFYAFGNPITPSTNFIWSTTGGTVISGQGTQNATIQWTSPGLQTVTATPAGPPNPYCTANETYTVNVVQVNPPVSITGPNVVCANGSYTYSTPPPPSGLDIQWTVTNGTISGSSHANPVSVTWGPSGPYSISVSYVNTTAPFCASVPFTLPVSLFSVAAITGSGNVCMDQTVTYTAGSPNPALDYQWSILSSPSGPVAPDGSVVTGQGSNQVSILWHGPGSVTVYLQMTVCSTTLTLPVTINPNPAPTITATGQLCNPVTLSATPGFSSYSWSNGATGNPIAVTVGGQYTVTVTNASGCIGTATINVPQPPGPTASISTPDPISYCTPLSAPINVTLHALQGSPAYSYVWYPGAIPGGSTFNVTAPGSYYVVVTDANGCSATSNTITVSAGPCPPPPVPCNTNAVIDFTIGTPICNPVSFADASTGGVTGQSWNFGDPASGANNTSASLTPSHTFTQAGYYTVTYSGLGPNTSPPPSNCALLVTHTLSIPLVADFSSVPACAGMPSVFTDHSTYLPPATLTYSWNFGDPPSGTNNTSTLQNPTHIYSAGTYTVTLTVSNGVCTVTQTKSITINPLPNAAFVLPLTTCVGTDIAMNATTPGLTYLWQFGDGATSALQNTSHAYTSTGIYTVTLTVTDAQGCSKSSSQSVTIIPAPGACYISPMGPVTVCPNLLPYTLTAPPGSSYQWFKDGVAIAGPAGIASTLAVSVAGSYAVTVTDANGCKCKTPPVVVAVNPKPIVNISVSPSHLVCLGSGTNIATLTTPPGPGSYTFQWFKNGTPVGTTNTLYETYGVVGLYNYTVVVTDTSTGCIDSAMTTIVVCNVPAAPIITAGGSTNLCQGDSVTLTSSIGPPSIVWSTGQTTQSITVHASGTYTVTYTDPGCGCKSTASIVVKVFPYPDFTLFPFDGPNCCDKICDTAHICAPKGYLGYQWLLNGVPVPPPMGNAEEFYPPASGSYQLILTGPNGCTDTSKPYCVVLVNCSGTCVTPPSDMVAWWPLNDPHNGILDSEIVGSHYGAPKPGAIQNFPTWTTGFGPSPASSVVSIGGGKVGDALYFFGQKPTRPYVDVPHSSAITFSTSDMSIDAWVYVDKDSGGIQPIVEKVSPSPGGGLVGYRLYLMDGKLTFDVAPATPSTTQYATPLVPGAWHFVVATLKRNMSPKQYKLYLDGSLVQTTPISGISSIYETANLHIGSTLLPTEISQLHIAIDELELFTRAIDSAEVYSLWHAGSKGKCRVCDQACEGAICGMKWNDKNHNGVFDPKTETGIPNWNIFLVVADPNGHPTKDTIKSTTTDSQGKYCFTNLCAGDYVVVEQQVKGWRETYPTEPNYYFVTITDTQIVGGLNFGNWHPKILPWTGVGIDTVSFVPDSIHYGTEASWPLVIAQLNPYHVLFNGIYGPGTDAQLPDVAGTYSIRRKHLANFKFSRVFVNDEMIDDGTADSVVVTLSADSSDGVTVAFFNLSSPDTSVSFHTFTADQFAQADQAKPIKIKKGQKTFAGNTANIIAQIILQQKGKMIVGKPGQLNLGRKIKGYLAPGSQSDVFATFNTKGFTHTNPAHGIDFDTKGNVILKLQKKLPYSKHNNKLLADMLALEINILASDAGITPPGFGDLVLLDSLLTTDSRRIKSGGTIREFADSVNNIMTNWEGVPQDIYLNLDNLVEAINSAFSKPLPLTALDTLSWMQGKNLKLSGAVQLQNVPYLLKVSGSAAALNPTKLTKGIALPQEFALHQNYPNPFNPMTVLSYDLPVSSHVTLTIYNTLGQVVQTLVDEVQEAGYRSVQWNAGSVASGVYFYRIQAVGADELTKTFTEVKKMVLIK
jgi:PKD repeat protein